MSQNNLHEDEQYRDVIRSLKNLKKVDAPPGFEQQLFRKLREETPVPQQGFWAKLIESVLFIPAAGTAVVASLVFVFLSLQTPEQKQSGETIVKAPPVVNEAFDDSTNLPGVSANNPTLANEVRSENKNNKAAGNETKPTYPSALQSKPAIVGGSTDGVMPLGNNDKVTETPASTTSEATNKMRKATSSDTLKQKRKLHPASGKEAEKKVIDKKPE